MEHLTKQTNGSLTNKKVVILGGSSGIGLATAKAAANAGATVTIVSSNQQRIDSALLTLPDGNSGFAVDLTDEQKVKALFTQLGTFDHLIYTAGENLQLATIADVALADAQKFFNLRYWGAFMAVKYASPNINVGGSITLTSGIAAVRPPSGWSLGASICAAMEGFTKAMAVELAPVRVNLVSPGLVNTNLWDKMAKADKDALFTSIGNNLPVKRIGEAEDIALTYLYLMQQQYSTGQTLVVDGGNVLV
jgi:NAD(P)-dependent dehydrogenase (short-subunit alcohol dehydrogenase family)